uniref:polymeric immunoglobulin receptor-like 3.5 precursor n=1 Tax=Danio rerio TaxID=7955 RepID=UPI0003E9D197|nr:polymeric immunoglobulin receptor-like 3.5 precursor [Danio rerio]AHH83817.1 polymeric immunoglobulin receptor-like group 3-5 transcript variant 3 [Danio rerio]|eukprot:NP_001293027.1 polymeric immunoglobulin receptor-like 3.5 precursor [Danio rerio]
MIHTLILTGVLLHIGNGAWIDKLNIGVKSGSPGIIPCLYKEQYKENHKYWCQGMFWSSCTILAFGNGPRSKFSITYYPAQSIFTVKWQNLQPSDSGYYWCAVEIGDSGIPDARYYLYLKVQPVPDVSVKSSSVSGHEGGNVSVQCFYSSEYHNKLKGWCRVKDKRCFKEEKTDTSQNPSVQISDDGESSFTVLMAELRFSDSGWYFCSVGDLQVPVRLTVTKPEPKAAMTTGSRPKSRVEDPPTTDSEINMGKDSKDEQNKYDMILIMCLVVTLALLLLVALFTIIIRRMRKNPEGDPIREERFNSSTMNTMPSENQMTSISPAEADSSADDSSMVYSLVPFTKTCLSSVDPEPDVLYSAVMKDRKTV